MVKEAQLNFTFVKGLEKKAGEVVDISKRPKGLWSAWNTAKKVPYNSRPYQPGRDFAHVKGNEAKKSLSGMFPDEAGEIHNMTAKQARKAYYDIRSVYFS